MIRRNIAANVVGGGTAAVTALLLIPIQLRQLGVEAYGLIGFLASLQILFSLFDLGLSPAVTWYVARAGGDAPRTARLVLARLAPVYALIGAALGVALVLAAPWLASEWLRLVDIPVDSAVATIRLAGVAVMLRWPVSLLAGSLAGLQRFGRLNVSRGIHALVNFTGAVVVLFVWHDIVVFAGWLVLSSVVELSLYLIAVRAATRGDLPHATRVEMNVLWRYAWTLAAISALSLVLTQSDRVVLARLVTTARLGEYAAAYNLLFGLTLIQLFVASAMYPAFASDFAAVNLDRIRDRHYDAAQVIIFLYSLPFALLVIFGEPVLDVFLSREAAASTAPVMALLAVGFLFNALAAVPFSLAIAGGLSRVLIIVNSVSLAWYLPALVIGVLTYGAAGAAAAWAALNVWYLFAVIPIVQRRLLGGGTVPWVRSVFVPFPLIGLALFGAARLIVGARDPHDPALWLAIIVSTALYAIAGLRLLRPGLRASARRLFSRAAWTGPASLA